MVNSSCRILHAVHRAVPIFPPWSASHASTSGKSHAYFAMPLFSWVSGKGSIMAATFIVLPAGGQSHGTLATSVGAASISHRMPPFFHPAHAPSAPTTIVMPSHTPRVLIFTVIARLLAMPCHTRAPDCLQGLVCCAYAASPLPVRVLVRHPRSVCTSPAP